MLKEEGRAPQAAARGGYMAHKAAPYGTEPMGPPIKIGEAPKAAAPLSTEGGEGSGTEQLSEYPPTT